MKKIILFILLFVFSITIVNAKGETNFEVVDAKIFDKSGAVEVIDPVFSVNEINSNIIFKKLNDSVTYEITVKNDNDEEYKIVGIEDNNENDSIKVTYDYKDESIKAHEKTSFKVKVEYNKEVKNIEKVTLKNFNIVLNVENEKGESEEVIIVPKTGDNIYVYVFTLVLSILAIISIVLIIHHKKLGKLFLVLAITLTPIAIWALNVLKININFKNIEIQGTFDVFSIELDEGNGKDPTVLSVTYGDKIGTLPTPTKEGYEFDKWVDEDGNTVDENTVITKEITLEAKFNIATYTITYHLDGGSSDNATGYTINDEVNLNDAVKENYVFHGWYTNEQFDGDKVTKIPTGSTGNKEFFAKFLIKEYHVKYTYNNQEIDKVIKHGEKVGELPSPTKDGYNFTGWYDEDNNLVDGNTIVTKDLNLTDKYEIVTYSITYNLDGGTAQNASTYTILDEVNLNDAVKENYIFHGWYTNEQFDGDKVTKIPTGSTGNKEFFAKFLIKEYHVKYTYNNQEIDKVIKHGEKVGELPSPTKDGYNFTGWYDEDNNLVDGNTIVTKDLNLTDKYEIVTYSITYNLDGGSVSTANPTTYTVVDNIVLTNPTKQGYTFAGWTGTGLDSASTSVTIATGSTGDRSYTATWTPNTNTKYTVVHKKMDLNGGYDNAEVETETLYGETASTITPDVKTYEGFTAPAKQQLTIAATGDASITYLYTRNRYTITFNGNGGLGLVDNISLYYGETKTLPGNGFVRLDYLFDSWNTSDDGTGTSYNPGDEVSNLSTEDGATITLYVKWNLNPLLTVNIGYGLTNVTATGWTSNGTTSISRRVIPSETVDLSTINVTYKKGYEGRVYTKTTGSGNLNNGNYVMDSNDATIEIAAAGLTTPNTPTITGGKAVVYNKENIQISCSTDSEYDSDVTLHYAFGYPEDVIIVENFDDLELYDEISVAGESFYVINIDRDNEEITALARYPITETGKQSNTEDFAIRYSNTDYWVNGIGTTYPGSYTGVPKPYIYDNNSSIYNYVENYATNLANKIGVNVTAKLLSYEQALALPNNIRLLQHSNSAYYTYWLGSTQNTNSPYVVSNTGTISNNYYQSSARIRPTVKFKVIKRAQYNDEPTNWLTYGTATTNNVLSDYKAIRYYSCRVYASDSVNSSEVAVSNLNSSTEVAFVNSRIDLDSTSGTSTGVNKIYVEYGSSNIYLSRLKSDLISELPEQLKDDYDFNGWWTSETGGVQVIDKDSNIKPNVPNWTDENGKWIRTYTSDEKSNDNTLYAQYTEGIKYLYNILMKAAKKNNNAKEYTGNHQDSMDASKSTEKIYHWYTSNSTNATEALNKNNILFANICWQLIRTTDTGGVRLLYNGEPTITGTGDNITYDCGTTRPGHIGGIKSTLNLSGNYYYGDGYTTSVSGTTTTYTLTNSTQISVNSTNASTVIPTIATNTPYTCRNATGTCTTLYKVDSVSSGTSAYVYASTPNRDGIGSSSFNSTFNSLGDVGYKYNTRYPVSSRGLSAQVTMLSTVTLDSNSLNTYGNYFFADSYTMEGNSHVLTNPVKGNTIENYPASWVGKYMCQSNSLSSCTTAYYVSGIDTSNENPVIYRAAIASAKEDTDSSYKYLFADSIIDRGNGVIELSGNVQEILQKNWYSEYSTKTNKYLCMPGYYTYDSVNDKYLCSDNGSINVGALRYVTSTKNVSITTSNIYKYGNGIVKKDSNYELIGKDNETGTLQYITNWANTSTSNCFANQGDLISSCGYKTLTKSHYTCFNLTGVCSTYNYINATTSSMAYFIQLTNGKYVSADLTDTNNVLYEMLRINNNDSIIKNNVETWYKNTLLTDYDRYIDDTIYCNNRTITKIGGWDPNADTSSNYQVTYSSSSPAAATDLSCPNQTDRFSYSNDAAKLAYKVAIISTPEMSILGISNIRATANNYYLMSPGYFNLNNSQGNAITANGTWISSNVNTSYSIRPAISLVSGMKYLSGDGSTTNPYIVDMNSLD